MKMPAPVKSTPAAAFAFSQPDLAQAGQHQPQLTAEQEEEIDDLF